MYTIRLKRDRIVSERRKHAKLNGQLVRVGRGDGKRVRIRYRPEGMASRAYVAWKKVRSFLVRQRVETLLKDRKASIPRAKYLGTISAGMVVLDMMRRERIGV